MLILSDGLGDAVGPDGTRFSDDRVSEVVAATSGGPEAIVKALCLLAFVV